MMSARAKPARGAAAPAIDWGMAAVLVAEGRTLATVARRVGCSYAELARRRRRDPVFREAIEEARLARLRERVLDVLEVDVRRGHGRAALWLAGRFELGAMAEAQDGRRELRALLDEMTPEELAEFEALGHLPPEDDDEDKAA